MINNQLLFQINNQVVNQQIMPNIGNQNQYQLYESNNIEDVIRRPNDSARSNQGFYTTDRERNVLDFNKLEKSADQIERSEGAADLGDGIIELDTIGKYQNKMGN